MKSVSPHAPDSEANPVLEAALTYAPRGWPVIPPLSIEPDGNYTGTRAGRDYAHCRRAIELPTGRQKMRR